MPVVRPARVSAAGFARATDLAEFVATAQPKAIVTAEGPLAPSDWRIACMTDADGRCAVTGHVAQHHDDPSFEIHHVIPKGLLRQRGLGAWVWDQRIGLVLREYVHAWFDDASDRCIPREVLRPEMWQAAVEIDEHLRSSWATEYLLDHYPLVGAERLAELRTCHPEGR